MLKCEMTIGWLGNGSIKVETEDFAVIETLKDFIEFQEGEDWCGVWEEADFDDEELLDEISEEETTVVE